MVDRVIQVCDIDHKNETLSEERRSFGLDGTLYEIDLCSKDNKTFEEIFAPYLTVARRVSNSSRSSRPVTGNATEVRAWAVENGYQVSERGRIPADIQAAYRVAHR